MWGGLIQYFVTTYTDMVIACLLQFSYLNFSELVAFVSVFLSFMTLFVILLFPMLLPSWMYNNSEKLRSSSFKSKFGACYEEIRPDLECCALHLPLQLLRKAVFAFCLTVLYYQTLVSLIFMSLLNLGMIYYIAAYKPYKEVLLDNKVLLEEFLFIVCQIMIGTLLKEDMNVIDKFNIGWTIIVTTGIIVICNMLLILKEQIKGFMKMYQIIKKIIRPRRKAGEGKK